MLKIDKNKGVSLIELMVAVGLSLTLILSMLAFYSISSKNVVDFQKANHDQQQIRKMMNLLETDIENTGGFECIPHTEIFTNEYKPSAIISLGDKLNRKQITFVHPVIAEYQYTALGMFKFNGNQLDSYAPRKIDNAGCGQDKSTIYIGTTILEMLPMNNIITTDATYSTRADTTMAFVALSSAQSRRYTDNNKIKTISTDIYTPNMNDATVMFLSDEENKKTISTGKNTVDIFLGFAPETPDTPSKTSPMKLSYIPDINMTNIKNGGWINPFASAANYNLVTDKTNNNNTPLSPNLLNQKLHQSTDADGKNMNSYPLKKELIEQVRAIKFVFTFGAHGDAPERKLTRVIRFKNTHLMKLSTE